MNKGEKYAVVHLGYFKQGDDLGHWVEKLDTDVEALEAHAGQMRSVAEHLDKLTGVFKEYDGKIRICDAGTHHISIVGDEKIIDDLVAKDLANEDPFEEEEEEEEDEDMECED